MNKPKVLLINIDSKIKNLALEKIAKYHADQGHEILWNFPFAKDDADKIYVSCIYDWNKDKCDEWEGIADIGGTGYDYRKVLPDEIESIKPHINLGFASRGCIRNCPFCIVPQKEGNVKIIGDLMDIWDGKSKEVTLLDNNVLALPDHFKLICKQARDNKINIEFNQGLDHRLLTDDIVHELKITSMREIRFAFDNIKSMESVEEAMYLLNKHKIRHPIWYVLVGYDSTPQEDLRRLGYIKAMKHRAYVQRYNYTDPTPYYIRIAQWANQRQCFMGMTFRQFLQTKKTYYKEVMDEICSL